jgi:hypothetical protein
MNHIPRIRRWTTGLAAAAIASLAGAPPALAIPLPPPGGGTGSPPPPPPSTTAAAHLPLWAVVTIMAATAVLSVATTLITLSLEHRRGARRTGPRPDPRPARQPSRPRQHPQPGWVTSSAATSTCPATTCTGPTAGKSRRHHGSHRGWSRRPHGVTIGHLRQGSAHPPVPRAPHRRPGSPWWVRTAAARWSSPTPWMMRRRMCAALGSSWSWPRWLTLVSTPSSSTYATTSLSSSVFAASWPGFPWPGCAAAMCSCSAMRFTAAAATSCLMSCLPRTRRSMPDTARDLAFCGRACGP